MKTRTTDVLIIGSGLSGLMNAELLSLQKNVMIFTKNNWEDSNSFLAQGGVAAVMQEDDHWFEHFRDTLQAGCFHNNLTATQRLVKDGPEMIKKLIDAGVEFDRHPDGTFQYGKEGAHHRARVLHIGGDATGRHLVNTVKRRVQNNTEIIEGETAVKLIVKNNRCVGVWSIDSNGALNVTYASAIILATGGLSGLYPVHSNAATITGDGIALAFDAGAEISDLEFVQFHPTLLISGQTCAGLVTEAVRGEGATLIDQHGKRIMDDQHPLKDLAPRDVVSRVLYHRREQGDETFLDVSGIDHFQKRFPTVTELCEKNGIALDSGLIPVAPGAHFTMGGIDTDLSGRTSIEGLYAVGEVANTGVHGANRLASNSLLEGLVFANRVADHLLKQPIQESSKTNWDGIDVLKHSSSFMEIREMMNKYIGIERNRSGLNLAVDWFNHQLSRTEKTMFPDLKEVQQRNQVLVGWLVASSALLRTESRGSHYRTDFPDTDEQWKQKRIKRRIHDYESVEITTGT